jgi:hypothetical protein
VTTDERRETPTPPRWPVPKASTNPPTERNDPEMVSLSVLSWKRDASGGAVVAGSRLENKNGFAIENPEVGCTHTLISSGEIIGRYSQIIRQIVGPKSIIYLHDVSTGFVVREGTRVACQIESFARY